MEPSSLAERAARLIEAKKAFEDAWGTYRIVHRLGRDNPAEKAAEEYREALSAFLDLEDVVRRRG